mmetsp:Transcript_111916/g.198205  ORF Transcript_111916/g.198205 Transcript_111916/m.198205 type:complete len:147 (+) Transcript_111916:134-574(+)
MAFMMKQELPRLHSAYSLEQAVMGESSKVVCLRISQDHDPECMKMDEILSSAKSTVEEGCNIFCVDVREVPECIPEFQLTEPLALIFFFKGKPLQLDLGEGPRAKITWALGSTQEFVDLVEACHRGGHSGRDLIIAPRDYSMAFRY